MDIRRSGGLPGRAEPALLCAGADDGAGSYGVGVCLWRQRSQGTKDAFSNVSGSAYGQDGGSAFNQVEGGSDILVSEVAPGSGSRFKNGVLEIDPSQTDSMVWALEDSDGEVFGGSSVSLESIIVHEVLHVHQRRTMTEQEIQALKNAEGEYGNSAFEDQAIDEANLYRSEVGEDQRVWYFDYQNCLDNEI